MKLVQIFALIEWLIIKKILRTLKPHENESIDDWALDRLNRYDEINAYVIALLKRNRETILKEIYATVEQARDTVLEHVNNHWGELKDEQDKKPDISDVIDAGIAYFNLYVMKALPSTDVSIGTVQQMYESIIHELEYVQDEESNKEEFNEVLWLYATRGLDSGYVDKSGRVWKMAREVGRIAMHLVADTINSVEYKELKKRNVELVRVGMFNSPRKACSKLQLSGIICIVPREEASAEASIYPNIWDDEHKYLEPSGHRGINCRHEWIHTDGEIPADDIYAQLDEIRSSMNVNKANLEALIENELDYD